MLEIRRSRRWTRAAAATAGLAASMAVVAMAAWAPLAHPTPVNAGSARTPITALFMLLVAGGVVALGALGVLVWQSRRRRGDDELELVQEPPQAHWFWKLAAILLPLALGAALAAAAVLGIRTGHGQQTLERGRGVVGRPSPAPIRPRGAGNGFVVPGWLPWTVLAIVGVGIAVGAWLLLHRARSLPDESSDRLATRAAIEAAIGAIDSSGDPRSAVIAAYAAMERTLAANGVARSPAEAPREYLRRVLLASSATEREARTLTGLFEEARFSTHPISTRVREVALSALSSLRTRLYSAR